MFITLFLQRAFTTLSVLISPLDSPNRFLQYGNGHLVFGFDKAYARADLRLTNDGYELSINNKNVCISRSHLEFCDRSSRVATIDIKPKVNGHMNTYRLKLADKKYKTLWKQCLVSTAIHKLSYSRCKEIRSMYFIIKDYDTEQDINLADLNGISAHSSIVPSILQEKVLDRSDDDVMGKILPVGIIQPNQEIGLSPLAITNPALNPSIGQEKDPQGLLASFYAIPRNNLLKKTLDPTTMRSAQYLADLQSRLANLYSKSAFPGANTNNLSVMDPVQTSLDTIRISDPSTLGKADNSDPLIVPPSVLSPDNAQQLLNLSTNTDKIPSNLPKSMLGFNPEQAAALLDQYIQFIQTKLLESQKIQQQSIIPKTETLNTQKPGSDSSVLSNEYILRLNEAILNLKNMQSTMIASKIASSQKNAEDQHKLMVENLIHQLELLKTPAACPQAKEAEPALYEISEKPFTDFNMPTSSKDVDSCDNLSSPETLKITSKSPVCGTKTVEITKLQETCSNKDEKTEEKNSCQNISMNSIKNYLDTYLAEFLQKEKQSTEKPALSTAICNQQLQPKQAKDENESCSQPKQQGPNIILHISKDIGSVKTTLESHKKDNQQSGNTQEHFVNISLNTTPKSQTTIPAPKNYKQIKNYYNSTVKADLKSNYVENSQNFLTNANMHQTNNSSFNGENGISQSQRKAPSQLNIQNNALNSNSSKSAYFKNNAANLRTYNKNNKKFSTKIQTNMSGVAEDSDFTNEMKPRVDG